MKDARVDAAGQLRCWNCGVANNFKQKRTFRSKVLVGVGALITKKKLKCNACGEYNQTGGAKPYTGPANKRLGKKFKTRLEDLDAAAVTPAVDGTSTPAAVVGPPPGWYANGVEGQEQWWNGLEWSVTRQIGATQ